MIKKYKTKPVEIEAIQWTGDNTACGRDIYCLNGADGEYSYCPFCGGEIEFETYD